MESHIFMHLSSQYFNFFFVCPLINNQKFNLKHTLSYWQQINKVVKTVAKSAAVLFLKRLFKTVQEVGPTSSNIVAKCQTLFQHFYRVKLEDIAWGSALNGHFYQCAVTLRIKIQKQYCKLLCFFKRSTCLYYIQVKASSTYICLNVMIP